MAQRTILEAERPIKSAKSGKRAANGAAASSSVERERVFEAFRRWGYLEASLDPLEFLEPLKTLDLDGFKGRDAEEARRMYSGTIGADFRPAAVFVDAD